MSKRSNGGSTLQGFFEKTRAALQRAELLRHWEAVRIASKSLQPAAVARREDYRPRGGSMI
jgi:hypothetical protein